MLVVRFICFGIHWLELFMGAVLVSIQPLRSMEDSLYVWIHKMHVCMYVRISEVGGATVWATTMEP